MITIEETAASFSEDLPEWQRQINLTWLRQVHAVLAEGGVWASPNLGKVYKRVGVGFEEMDI